jgi:hypothetical protein
MFAARSGAGGDANYNQDVLEFILRCFLMGINSSYRYWSGLAEVYGRYYPEMDRLILTMSSDPSEREEARQTLLNNLSACCREMSDISNKEVRRFQAELAEVLAKVWPAETTDESGQYWRRRWNAKP